MELKLVIGIGGMVEYCDVYEQVTVETGGRPLSPAGVGNDELWN